MLILMTVLIMAIVAYCYIREGLFTAFVMCINVLIAGLVAFNFWEPLAALLEPALGDSFLHGFEDSVCLVALFCVALGGLRWATNNLAVNELDFPMPLLRGGGVFFGLVTGYLISGFLVCVLQTLPWHTEFMGFKAKYGEDAEANAMRRFLPADRVWLALMHREGLGSFGRSELPGDQQTFDANASFELRYDRYRRYTDSRDALPYDGFCPAVTLQAGMPTTVAATPDGKAPTGAPSGFKPSDGPKITVPGSSGSEGSGKPSMPSEIKP